MYAEEFQIFNKTSIENMKAYILGFMSVKSKHDSFFFQDNKLDFCTFNEIFLIG